MKGKIEELGSKPEVTDTQILKIVNRLDNVPFKTPPHLSSVNPNHLDRLNGQWRS